MSITWEISELADGLRVVTTPVPTAQSVSVNVFVGAGSRGEDERTKGLAHFRGRSANGADSRGVVGATFKSPPRLTVGEQA